MRKILAVILCCVLIGCTFTACGNARTDNEKASEEIIYTVVLTETGDDRLSVIKAYRELTSIGLGEARDTVDSAPCILLVTTDREEAESYKTALEDCGATVSVSESASENQ